MQITDKVLRSVARPDVNSAILLGAQSALNTQALESWHLAFSFLFE